MCSFSLFLSSPLRSRLKLKVCCFIHSLREWVIRHVDPLFNYFDCFIISGPGLVGLNYLLGLA